MQINKCAPVAFGLVILLSGCAAPPTPILPTTTPAPTVAEPTATATFLPPPTVTPFPTATARDPNATIPVITATPGSPEPSSPTPATTVTTGAVTPQSSPAPQASPTPARSPTPTLSPTPIVSGLPDGVTLVEMIYAADFSQGWPTIDESAASLEIVNGQYVFEIGPFNAYFLTTTAVNRRDMYVQVEVTPEECPQRGGYGMIYRYRDAANYYLFTIFCDRTYTVIAKVAGSIIGVTNGTLPTGADPTAASAHRIGVLTRGDAHNLFFDGQQAATFTDRFHADGDVAIYAASQSSDVIIVAFDNLKVWTVH